MERSPKGEVLLEASYLDGLPHGQQLRRFPDGAPALEAIFDRGVLSGVKTRWWTNGRSGKRNTGAMESFGEEDFGMIKADCLRKR